jgi:hypothetical protein
MSMRHLLLGCNRTIDFLERLRLGGRRPNLEINELKTLCERWLALAVNIVTQGRRFSPLFDVVSATGHDTVGVNPGENTDPVSAKNATAAKVRDTIHEKDAFAVVQVCDEGTLLSPKTTRSGPLPLGADTASKSWSAWELANAAKRSW